MSHNPAFVFPPPPPPPPRALTPEQAYHGILPSRGRGTFRGSRGSHSDSGRGRGHSQSNGSSHGNHRSAAWKNGPSHGSTSHQRPRSFTQPPYGQSQLGGAVMASSPTGHYAQQLAQHQSAGATYVPLSYPSWSQAQPSAFSQSQCPTFYPFMSNQNMNLPSNTVSPINTLPASTPSTNGNNPQNWTHPSGQVQPPFRSNQPQNMGAPSQMGFDNTPRPMIPSLSSASPTSPPYISSPSSQYHHAHATDIHSRSNAFTIRQQQSPSLFPFDKTNSRDNGTSSFGREHAPRHSSNPRSKRPRTGGPHFQTAPDVPTFLAPSLPPKPELPNSMYEVTSKQKKRKKRKHNALGLTPRTVEREESEDDDVDEEATLRKKDEVMGNE